MKFLPELGSCCGGATAKTTSTTTARNRSSAVASLPKDDVGRPYQGGKSLTVTVPSEGRPKKVKPANSSRQWKPSLRVISEDAMMVSDNNESSQAKAKAKAKEKEKSRPKPKSPYHGEEHWKSSGMWSLPVFYPSAVPF